MGLTNSALLRKKIKDSGLKRGFIVGELDTSYHWLNRKIAGEVEFTAGEIKILCELLGITDLQEKECIFFAEDVEENSTAS